MKCGAVRRRLSEYLDSELPERESARVAGHLAGCPSCRREAEGLRQSERALSSLSAEVAAPELTADLRARLGAAPGRGRRWVWACGVAAAIGAVALWWALAHPRDVGTGAGHSRGVVAVKPRQGVEGSTNALLRGGRARGPATGEDANARPTATAANRLQPPAAPRGASEAKRPNGTTQPTVLVRTPPADTSPETETVEAVSPEVKTPAVRTADVPMGIILILGEPQPIIPRSECYLEVTLPDGTRSVTSQVVERNATGESREIQIAYESGQQ